MLTSGRGAAVQMYVEEHVLWVPVSEDDKEQVVRQMERLLETTHFRNSRRYPALFRFIVEETLAGRGEFLKERLLGVQVFGRPSDYDTAGDPVVRVTVAEIRKRIAQYYHDESHTHELRIELMPGRYAPEFRVSRGVLQPLPGPYEPAPVVSTPVLATPVLATPVLAAPVLAAPASENLSLPARGHVEVAPPRRPRRLVWAGSLFALLAVSAAACSLAWRTTALDRFWEPVLGAHQPVILCLPVAGGKYGVAANSKVTLLQAGPAAPGLTDAANNYLSRETLGENVVFSDVRAMTSLSDLLAQRKAEQRLRLNTAVTMDDLRQGPAILIGAMDNPWTLRALSHLRYQFGGNDQEIYWIVDTKSGQPTEWSLDLKLPTTSVTRDYAIIARVHAEDTGQPQVLVAGIGMSGTAAAGELLTSAATMELLRQRVGKAFDHADFEAVISTDVVNGIAGSPKILTIAVR